MKQKENAKYYYIFFTVDPQKSINLINVNYEEFFFKNQIIGGAAKLFLLSKGASPKLIKNSYCDIFFKYIFFSVHVMYLLANTTSWYFPGNFSIKLLQLNLLSCSEWWSCHRRTTYVKSSRSIKRTLTPKSQYTIR